MNSNSSSSSSKGIDIARRYLTYRELADNITPENVNQRSPLTTQTALMYSALENIDRMKRLDICLKNGADVNIQNNHPLDRYHSTTLHLLIVNESIRDAIAFMALTKKYDKPIDYNVRDREDKTTLVLACKMRNEEAAAALLAEKVLGHALDINLPDNLGNTALHYACAYGMVAVAATLIQQGADVNLKNKKNRTPVDLIVATGEEINGWLNSVSIESTRDEKATYNIFLDKYTMLFVKNRTEELEIPATKKNILRLASELKYDIYDSGRMTRTEKESYLSKDDKKEILASVLHFTGRSLLQACLDSKRAMLDFMLKQQNVQFGYLFRINAHNNHPEELKLILDQYPSVLNEVGLPSMRSTLHFAAAKGFVDICAFLIECKADATLSDREGNTALQLACEAGHITVIKKLLEIDCKVDHLNQNKQTAWELLSKFLERTVLNENLKAEMQALFTANRLGSSVVATSVADKVL